MTVAAAAAVKTVLDPRKSRRETREPDSGKSGDVERVIGSLLIRFRIQNAAGDQFPAERLGLPLRAILSGSPLIATGFGLPFPQHGAAASRRRLDFPLLPRSCQVRINHSPEVDSDDAAKLKDGDAQSPEEFAQKTSGDLRCSKRRRE